MTVPINNSSMANMPSGLSNNQLAGCGDPGMNHSHIPSQFPFLPVDTDITFSDGGHMATLCWKNGKLSVKGDLDEAAGVMFNIVKWKIDAYIAEVAPFKNLEYLEWLHEKKQKGNV